MIYGTEPTQNLLDNGRAPRESLPVAKAIHFDARYDGAPGRKALRKALGPENEKSNRDLPGLRGFCVWRFVLRDGVVETAPDNMDATGLATVYLLGPTARTSLGIEATRTTTGAEAAIILTHVAGLVDVTI
jgi:hypothetical protein